MPRDRCRGTHRPAGSRDAEDVGEVILERLRQLAPQLTLIMVTANGDVGLAKRTLELGASTTS